MKLRKLSLEEELDFIKEIHGNDTQSIFAFLRECFALLQARAQMLLGLATICLTITGFSGPRMARSNPYSRVLIGVGLLFVLAAVVAVVAGPLRLRWMTAWRAESLDTTLLENLRRRATKTRLYSLATVLLLVGLIAYLLSMVFYLLLDPV